MRKISYKRRDYESPLYPISLSLCALWCMCSTYLLLVALFIMGGGWKLFIIGIWLVVEN